ncbi:MAG: hypothetical protein HKN28_09850 [Alphaproteobacteria bacterium]|nr:hypothetical protein [Alphaproteobacteria bacterium]
MLTPRWTPLRFHPVQQAYWNSPSRFNTVPAGRRSGKTELAKRKLVKRALVGTEFDPPRFFAGAPTREQAKRIFWDDLKLLIPRHLLKGRPSEVDLMIRLINGAQIWVIGLDRPERIEGSPWDGGVLDEYGNMRASAWPEHIRPALSDRGGWCDFTGVPEGRNHYYDLDRAARAQMTGLVGDWASFHWISADILPPDEIAAARRDLDDLTYRQEYEASFVSFEGQAYYPFAEGTHCARLKYDPRADLVFCFDFNVAPEIAAIVQEQMLPNGLSGTGVIGEVHIPRNSSTPAVCRRLIADWGGHQGRVICHSDSTGGARGSAKVLGSDWDLIRAELSPLFGSRLRLSVPRANPPERVRVNAVNARLKSAAGDVRLMVDPVTAPQVQKDFEGVRLLAGGAGEIDKKVDPGLTHLSDAIGYYIARQFPLVTREVTAHATEGH